MQLPALSAPVFTRARSLEPLAAAFLVFVFVAAASAAESDWRQWRGPNFDGTSAETGLPLVFGPSQNVVWKTPMAGRSGSTPIVVGDRIFLTTATEDQSDKSLEFWALDADTGKVLWTKKLGGGDYFRMKHNMSSPSPVSDGSSVWVMTGTGVIKAFDFDGNESWSRDLQKEYGAFGLNHGYGASPLLADGVLYVPVLHGMNTDDPSYVVAIEASTGETKWRVERPTDALMESPDAYTTPVLWEHDGTTDLVVTGADYVTGHSLAIGEELWRLGGLNPDRGKMYRIVASPVVAGETVLVPTRVRPMQALRARGAGATPAVAWKTDKGPDVPTPSVQDGLVYVLSDRGMLTVHELDSGDVVYGPERLETGTYSASPLVAEGRLYAVSEEGTVTVAKLGRAFEVLAVNEVDEYTLSSLVAARGRIYHRTDKHLYCFDASP